MAEVGGAFQSDAVEYVRALQRRKGIVAFTAIVVVATALFVTQLQTPVYEGAAQLLLRARSTESLVAAGAGNDPARAPETEIRLLTSDPVQAKVEQKLGQTPGVSASLVAGTEIIEVRAQSSDPEAAALIANAYARAYIEFRRERAVEDILAANEEFQAKVDELQADITALEAQIVAALGARNTRDADALSARRDTLVSQQSVFEEQLDQLQVGAALTTGGAQLVKPADPPTSPIKPTPRRNAIIALMAGLILGVAFAFAFDYLDDSIRVKDDLERATGGTPTLGMIPLIPDWKRTTDANVISLTEPDSSGAEAYRALRTSVQFLGLDQPLRTIQMTSPSAAEGKSTTLANLAVVLAGAGQRVCVVDCDLRRPRIHQFFNLPNDIGFTSALLGTTPLSLAIQEVRAVAGLGLLASGPSPPLPSELLASYRTGEVFQALHDRYDIVLVDSPPTLPVTDASVLAQWVDGVLLVASAGITSFRHVHRAVELLRQVDAPIIGTVLNQAPSLPGYGYGYGYGYGPDGDRRSESTGVRRLLSRAERPDAGVRSA